MGKKCGLFVEFCLGLGTILLIASSLLYFLTLPRAPEAKPSAPGLDLEQRYEKRYEALLQEKGELEREMEIWDGGWNGRAWLTPKDSSEGERACRFVPYISEMSGDVSARVLIGFERGEDMSADRLLVIADGVEQEIPMAEIRREAAPVDEERLTEVMTLPVDLHLPLLGRVAESELVALRLLGGGEEREAILSESQIQNLRKVLRLREIYKEAWVLQELRRML